MDEKPIVWLGTSKEDVRRFSEAARRDAGFELYQVQRGLDPTDWKPMASVAPGVREIRIHERNEYRVLFVARFAEAVYVLHAFVKKTQHTSQHDLELARRRFQQLVRARRSRP